VYTPDGTNERPSAGVGTRGVFAATVIFNNNIHRREGLPVSLGSLARVVRTRPIQVGRVDRLTRRIENSSDLLGFFLENFAKGFAVGKEIRVILEPNQEKALEHTMPFKIAFLKFYRRRSEIPLIS
jgi:hypothetical protein